VCNLAGVLQVKLASVLLVQIGHEDFESLVAGLVKVVLDSDGSQLLRQVHLLGSGGVTLLVGSSGRRKLRSRSGDVQIPVLAVHLANHVGTATTELVIQEADFVAPAAVRSTLLVRVQEVLTAVEDAVRRSSGRNALDQVGLLVWEASLECSDFEHARQTAEEGSGAASLEDQLVRENKHARLGEQVGVDVAGLNDGQNLAVDQVKHLLPGILGNSLQAQRGGRRRKRLLRWAEPYL
jgi:hypothetical protein